MQCNGSMKSETHGTPRDTGRGVCHRIALLFSLRLRVDSSHQGFFEKIDRQFYECRIEENRSVEGDTCEGDFCWRSDYSRGHVIHRVPDVDGEAWASGDVLVERQEIFSP